ncbi:MAG TPA: DoxX family membrane protein, partial [Ramlibacter sp.]|nr:DoxX family membrane protein [Ramlibacter sp.]
MTPSTQTRDLLALISRVLLAVLFIPAGIEKIPGFAGTVHYISAHN